jgi:hypothetical protein
LIFDTAQVLAWRAITAAAATGGAATAKLVRLQFERDALESELERTKVT